MVGGDVTECPDCEPAGRRTPLAQGKARRFHDRRVLVTEGGYHRFDHVRRKADAYLTGSSTDGGRGIGQSSNDVRESQPAHPAERSEGCRPHRGGDVRQPEPGGRLVPAMASNRDLAPPLDLVMFLRPGHGEVDGSVDD